MTTIQTTSVGSTEYQQELELRRRILREPLGLTFTPEDLAKEESDYHIVALQEDRVVGCLLLKPLSSKIVKIRQVAVDTSLQKSGIGRSLVAFCETFAFERGYSRVELSARSNAVPFYEKLGYLSFGEPFIEVTIPHQKMFKPL